MAAATGKMPLVVWPINSRLIPHGSREVEESKTGEPTDLVWQGAVTLVVL